MRWSTASTAAPPAGAAPGNVPMGVDHALITHLGRYILSLIGIVPKALQVSVREQLEGETHNTSKIPKAALLNTLEFLSEEMEESLGVKWNSRWISPTGTMCSSVR